MKNINVKYLIFVVPIIMSIFFIRNIYLVNQQNMDSWMGGGFRMFATIDKMVLRSPVIDIEIENNTYTINMRNVNQLSEINAKLRILPSEKRFNEAKKIIESLSWCLYGDIPRICDLYDEAKVVALREVRIYGVKYDKLTKRVRMVPVRSYEFSN